MRQATASLRLNWFASTQNGPACPSNAWRTMSASKNSRLASCALAIWADATLIDRTRTDHVIEVRMLPSGLSALADACNQHTTPFAGGQEPQAPAARTGPSFTLQTGARPRLRSGTACDPAR